MGEKITNAVAEFISAVTKLVRVKTFITFALVYLFVFLAKAGLEIPDSVMTIVTTVVAFYFGTQAKKE